MYHPAPGYPAAAGDSSMRPRSFTLPAAVSAVLCAALVALWARSYWQVDGVLLASADLSESYVASREGRLCFGTSAASPEVADSVPRELAAAQAGRVRLVAMP